MILFTSRLMPGEVSPRADRETQESEFYFTDHSLTGQSTSFRPLLAYFIQPTPNFFPPIAL